MANQTKITLTLSQPKALLAELLGTFFLTLAAAGAGAVNGELAGAVGGTAGSLAVGQTVLVLVLVFGPLSGAHFNPAVSLGAMLAGRLPKDRLWQYIAAQCTGALLAALFLKLALRPALLGTTAVRMNLPGAFAVEMLLSALLVWVILAVTEREVPLLNAALAIGTTLVVCGLWAGPLTGASLNPARSLGPALLSLDFANLWLYLAAPLAGAFVAARGYAAFKSLS